MKRAGGVLGLNGNANPACGTEQSGQSSRCQGPRFSSLSKAIALTDVVKVSKISCVTFLRVLPASALLPAAFPPPSQKSGCAEPSPFLHTFPLALKEICVEFPLFPPACCKHCILSSVPRNWDGQRGGGWFIGTGLALRWLWQEGAVGSVPQVGVSVLGDV